MIGQSVASIDRWPDVEGRAAPSKADPMPTAQVLAPHDDSRMYEAEARPDRPSDRSRHIEHVRGGLIILWLR